MPGGRARVASDQRVRVSHDRDGKTSKRPAAPDLLPRFGAQLAPYCGAARSAAAAPSPRSRATNRSTQERTVMATAEPQPQATAAVAVHRPQQLILISHSSLFYWWPVWAFGYLMALLTLLHAQQVDIGGHTYM